MKIISRLVVVLLFCVLAFDAACGGSGGGDDSGGNPADDDAVDDDAADNDDDDDLIDDTIQDDTFVDDDISTSTTTTTNESTTTTYATTTSTVTTTTGCNQDQLANCLDNIWDNIYVPCNNQCGNLYYPDQCCLIDCVLSDCRLPWIENRHNCYDDTYCTAFDDWTHDMYYMNVLCTNEWIACINTYTPCGGTCNDEQWWYCSDRYQDCVPDK